MNLLLLVKKKEIQMTIHLVPQWDKKISLVLWNRTSEQARWKDRCLRWRSALSQEPCVKFAELAFSHYFSGYISPVSPIRWSQIALLSTFFRSISRNLMSRPRYCLKKATQNTGIDQQYHIIIELSRDDCISTSFFPSNDLNFEWNCEVLNVPEKRKMVCLG